MGLALKRFLAFCIDYVVIAVYVAILTSISLSLTDGSVEAPTTVTDKLMGHAVAFVTLTLPVVLYFAFMEASKWQATLGKYLLRLHVVGQDNQAPTIRDALKRNILKFLPWETAHIGIWYMPGQPFIDPPGTINVILWSIALFLALMYLATLFVGNNGPLYDRLCGTKVTL